MSLSSRPFALLALCGSFLLADHASSPRLAGYALWAEASPRFSFEVDDTYLPVGECTILAACPDAEQVLLGRSREFKGSVWKPIADRVRFSFDIEEPYGKAVFAFKRRVKGQAAWAVSEPVALVLDRARPWRKVTELSEEVLLDWTTGAATVRAEAGAPGADRGASGRYLLLESKASAEAAWRKTALESFLRVPVQGGQTLREFARARPSLGRRLADWVGSLSVSNLATPRMDRLEVSSEVHWFRAPWVDEIAAMLRPAGTPPPSSEGGAKPGALVVDLRGLGFTPSLYPEIASVDGRTLWGGWNAKSGTLPVVYLRALDRKGTLPEGMKDGDAQFLRASGVDPVKPWVALLSLKSSERVSDRLAGLVGRGRVLFLVD